MEPQTLDLGGLPEPIARGLEAVVQMARNLSQRPEYTSDPPPQLPRWPLGTLSPLSREQIYDDYQYRC